MIIPGGIHYNEVLKDRSLYHPSFVLAFMVCGLVAWLAPAQSDQVSPELSRIVSALTSLIPSIEKWASLSEFPYATRLFFLAAWMFVPWQVLHLCRNREFRAKAVAHWQQSAARKIAMPLLGVPLIAIYMMGVFSFAFRDSSNCAMWCMNSSRWSLWLVGCVITSACACGAAFLLVWVREVPNIYIKASGSGVN